MSRAALIIVCLCACESTPIKGLPKTIAPPDLPGRELVENFETDSFTRVVLHYPSTPFDTLDDWRMGVADESVTINIDKRDSGYELTIVYTKPGGKVAADAAAVAKVAPPDAAAKRDEPPPKSKPSPKIDVFLTAGDKACDGGEETSCWMQGIVYARGLLGQKPDPARALEYFKRACGKRLDGPGCPETLAAKKKLSKKERKALESMCGLGRSDACVTAKSKQTNYQLCNAGAITSCLKTKPLPKDASPGALTRVLLPSKATKLARQAAAVCDRGAGFGCATLALGYLSGIYGLAKLPSQALALGKRSCNSKSVLGCFPAASAQLDIDGKSQAGLTKALGFAKRGCQGGNMQSCTVLAMAMGRLDDLAIRQQGLSFWLMACYLEPDKKRRGEACRDFAEALPKAFK